jgi:hypothetical protein
MTDLWRTLARCRTEDAPPFFESTWEDTACRFCSECPVQLSCLRDDLASVETHTDIHGVRGGLPQSVRRSIFRGRISIEEATNPRKRCACGVLLRPGRWYCSAGCEQAAARRERTA